MREAFVFTGIGQEGFLQVDFDDEGEAQYVYEILRSGFTDERERESSRRWCQIKENREELDNAFTQAWLMIKVARYCEDDEFKKIIGSDPQLIKSFSQMALEASKLILIMINSAGKTKCKGACATKKVRKRLMPVEDALKRNLGPEFLYKTITFPNITVHED